MQAIENLLKGVTVFCILVLILQYCLNNVLEVFTIKPVTLLQAGSGFVFIYLSVFFISTAWNKVK